MNRPEALAYTLRAGITTFALATLLAGCDTSTAVDAADITPIPIYTPWSAAAALTEATATATLLSTTQESASRIATITTTPTAAQEPATATPTAAQEPAAATPTAAQEPAAATPTAAQEPAATTPTAAQEPAATTPTAAQEPAAATTQMAAETPTTTPNALKETPATETADPVMPSPTDFAVALETANAVDGEQLTVSNGCIACHSLVKGQTMVGPSWYGIGSYAATRVARESAPYYLYQSIMDPNAHVVEGFMPDLMPKVYADTLSTAQIADIVAYLLSLQAE